MENVLLTFLFTFLVLLVIFFVIYKLLLPEKKVLATRNLALLTGQAAIITLLLFIF